eukprot:TRINITY_DN449_c10_g1_i1.p1 TRINITY_DN449_c10_g1~~TRINITY_DN449_c10_g1_i1.p1  ORF type:complete len:281 (+),score=52.26 TRINITY_DN449_c10_g1_i1:37-843(+)
MSAVSKLNPQENTILGVVCGCVEVSIMQPTLYCKNASQQGLSWSLDPRLLYRGIGVSIANMGLVTGIQFPLSGACASLFKKGENRELTSQEQIASGFVGGALSGFVCAPLEHTMIQQQRTGMSLLSTPGHLIKQLGPLGPWRGLSMTSGREGLYTAGYLGIGPVLTDYLQKESGLSAYSSKAIGAIIAGVVGSTLSHPMDTIKTCMQGDSSKAQYPTVSTTFSTLLREGGVARISRGWSWRCGRMIGAVFIISETQEFFAPFLFPDKF